MSIFKLFIRFIDSDQLKGNCPRTNLKPCQCYSCGSLWSVCLLYDTNDEHDGCWNEHKPLIWIRSSLVISITRLNLDLKCHRNEQMLWNRFFKTSRFVHQIGNVLSVWMYGDGGWGDALSIAWSRVILHAISPHWLQWEGIREIRWCVTEILLRMFSNWRRLLRRNCI